MPEDISVEKKVFDLGVELAELKRTETADDELLLARDLTNAFIKANKAFHFYPPDTPTLKGFMDILFKKFQTFLNKYETFVIQVREYDLLYKEKNVYENTDVKASLAFLLYRDGLREIRFLKGLEERELQGFIDTLKKNEQVNPLEDDLVTLLWENDFVHIGYLAAEEGFGETSSLLPVTLEQFRKNLISKPLAHQVEVDFIEEDSGMEIDPDEVLSRAMEEPSPFVSDTQVYSLTPDEIESLRKGVEAEASPLSAYNVLDLLFEMIALEEKKEMFQEIIGILNKMLDALLTSGAFAKAADLLNRVHRFLETVDLQDWKMEDLQKITKAAGDEVRLQRIGKMLEKEKIPLQDIGHYLSFLKENSIRSLIKLLGEIKNSKARRLFCDSIAEIGKNDIELITSFIDDRRWYLVRNIVYILGRMGQEQSFPYLQKAFSHEDIRVKREVIQALGLIGGSKAVSLLVRALDDPDVRIRSMAAVHLGKVGKNVGLVPLLELVRTKDFYKRDSVEIKAFFHAIGMAGSNVAIPVLQQLLERKSWLGRAKNDEIRLGAAQAIAMIGTPEAKAILNEGSRSKDESVRNLCLKALKGRYS